MKYKEECDEIANNLRIEIANNLRWLYAIGKITERGLTIDQVKKAGNILNLKDSDYLISREREDSETI